uniref:Polynucleotide 5'-hydroxyl-kinase NOL9 n=1 Tax=Glossina brevipalpis TaxID=37001 RepID=A0A1A9WEH5_9MUSC
MHKNQEYSKQNSMPSNAHEQLKRKLQQLFKSKNQGPGDKRQENRTNLVSYNAKKKYSAGTLFLDQSPYATANSTVDIDNSNSMDADANNIGNVPQHCGSKSTKNNLKTRVNNNRKQNTNKVGSSTSKSPNTSKKESNSSSTIKAKARQHSNENQIRIDKTKQQNVKSHPVAKKEKMMKNCRKLENKQEMDNTIKKQGRKEDQVQESKKRPLPAKMVNEPNKKVKILRKKMDKSRNAYESDSETSGCTDSQNNFYSRNFVRSCGGGSEGGRGDGPRISCNVKKSYYYDDGGEYLYEENTDENEDDDTSDDDEDYVEDEESDSDFDCMSNTFESGQNEASYYFGSDDDDDVSYKPPKHFVEDLVIHKGTAYKRDLRPDDKVNFKMNISRAQIIELHDEETLVKKIEQPKAYKKEELQKLNHKQPLIANIENNNDQEQQQLQQQQQEFQQQQQEPQQQRELQQEEQRSDECPQLVPIAEEPEDTLEQTEESESSDCLGCDVEIHDSLTSDSNESWTSIDINDKYTLKNKKDTNITKEMERLSSVDVIDATDCIYQPKEDVDEAAITEKNVKMCSDDKNELPADKLSKFTDYDTKSTILITAIADIPSETSVTEGSCTHVAVSEDLNTLIYSGLVENSAEERNQNLEHFRSIFCNAVSNNLVLVLLKDPFYIYGTIRLTLLTGNVDLYGHSPPLYTELEVFSPRGCTVVEISPKTPEVNPNLTKDALIEFLKSYDTKFTVRDLRRLADTYNPKRDAVLLLKPNKESKRIKQQFKKFMDQNVFPNIKTLGIERPLYGSEYRLRCVINTSVSDDKCLRVPKEWHNFALHLNSKVMIAGGKAVGKSTLLRFLINKFLPHFHNILLIDLDIGQPEIFVPQTVSCTMIKQPLIGPGFLLNLEPDLALAVGHVNIVLCPHRYIHAAKDLIKYCLSQQQYGQIPWLINTMGYNKGFALELMSEIALQLMPTDVIQLQSRKDINNFDFALCADVLNNVPKRMFLENHEKGKQTPPIKAYELHLWDSPAERDNRYQKDWDMSAKDLRYANLLTRLSVPLTNTAEWLTDCKPMSAPLHRLKLLNLLENVSYTQEELINAIEANLVYLCHYRKGETSLECCGIGVVRGIDRQIDQIYLVPATSITRLKRVNCLAIGEMPLPSNIFTYQGPRVKEIAPYVYNTVDANASKSIKHFPRRLNETCFKKD